MGLGESKPKAETPIPKGKNSGPPTKGQHHQLKHDRPRPAVPVHHNKSNPNAHSYNVKPQKAPTVAHQSHHRQQQPKVLTERNNKGHPHKPKAECNVCGHEGHTGDRCYHRHQTCQICFQPGHLRSVCRQKTHHPESVYKPKGGGNRPSYNH